jgi:hypothetical protein
MIRKFAVALAAIAALSVAVPPAQAGSRYRHVDKRVTVVAIGAGAASTAAFFAINKWKWNDWNNSAGLTRLGAWGVTTLGCAAISPMVATVVVNRPLTNREAGVLIGSCVVPIVGGWLVNEAYNAHPEWDNGPKPVKAHYKRSKSKKKKM